MIKHPVDNDAGEGNIEPDGKSNPRDLDVAAKLASEGAGEGHEGQGHHRHSKNGVRNEDRKIKRPNPAVSRKGRRPVEIMIREIGNQKKSGGPEGRTHTEGVARPGALPDEDPAQNQEERARGIEPRIERRKKRKNRGAHSVWKRILVS